MMSERIKRQRRFNALISGLLLTSGVVMMGSGGYLFFSKPEVSGVSEAAASELERRCMEAGYRNDMNEQPSEEPGSVGFYARRVQNPYSLLVQSSDVINRCDGFDLKRFCMGEGCDDGFLSFVMEMKK